ncbi:MAG: argininosuccinate synthase [Acidobacteriota bacterium]
MKKIVLAYSGGLDTSVLLHWLKAKYRCPVLAYVANVGQGENFDLVRRKAYRTGADDVYIADLRDPFVRQFVFPALQAHAVYEGEYLLGTCLARPLIAREQVRVAQEWGADCVAHGATGKGNDQVRFELTYQSLAPRLKILAPWRHWEFRGRKDLLRYARENGIAVPTTEEKPYSVDRNLVHSSYEGGILEDPWRAPPEEMFELTACPERAPERARDLTIEFEQGIPIALDDQRLEAVELVEALNRLGGIHGIGRVDLVENRMVGMKSRGVYETPGLTLLHKAHRALESLTMDREVQHLKDQLAPRLGEIIYNGFWFTPEMNLLLRTVTSSQKRISGEVRLRLYKGSCRVLGRRSPFSLYDPSFATFETDDVYRQEDAAGFIRLQGLRLKIAALKQLHWAQPEGVAREPVGEVRVGTP